MEKLMEVAKNKLKQKNIYGDIYIENIEKSEVIVKDSQTEKFTRSNTICGNVRVFKNGKMGFCYFSGNKEEIINDAISKAVNSTFVEGYEKYVFNNPKSARSVELYDSSYAALNDKDRLEKAILLEKTVKDYDYIKIVRDTIYTDSLEKIFYINSEGQECYYEKTRFSVYSSAIAEKNGSREIAEIYDINSRIQELNIIKIGKECARKAVNLLGGDRLRTGKYKIMLAPETACDFVCLFAKLFLGDNIVKGKSLFAQNKIGDKIGPNILTIKDDALLDFKIGSFPIDAEGELAQNKFVVEKGILKTFLFDKTNAFLYNSDTTGNAVRTSFKLLPECGVSNFYIDNGIESEEKITSDFKGVFVNSLMGLHMADTVSGNFSLAFNGWMVENGEKTKAIKESLITGNLKELLNKIILVGDNLKFYGNYGSPTIVIDDVEVIGA